jgi:murein DD-endopeptidase MepM/ murein hydrolase activator NlpD
VTVRAAAVAAAAALGVACAAAPRPPPPLTRAPAPVPVPGPAPLATALPHHEEPDVVGVVHVVQRGETLYRIARTYGIDPADLMETNGISDPRAVEIGTELFVPGASRLLEVPGAPGGAIAESTAPARPREPSRPRPDPLPAPAAERAREQRKDAGGTAPARAAAAERTVLSWPLRGVLYGRFGPRGGQRHDGIDIAAPEGTPVLAAADGSVIYAGKQAGYGAIVILRHDGGLVTVYAHASALLVHAGERVGRGEPVAKVGQTGKTTGPHLHFEVRDGTRPRDPLLYLR